MSITDMTKIDLVQLLDLYISYELEAKHLIERLNESDFTLETEKFIVASIDSEGVEAEPMKISFFLKCAYSKPKNIFCRPIISFLERARQLNDDDLFKLICEVEFSFTVLELIKSAEANEILNSFIEQPVSWDDGNIRNAAKYAIEGINS